MLHVANCKATASDLSSWAKRKQGSQSSAAESGSRATPTQDADELPRG